MPGLIPLLIVLVLAFLLFSKPGRISGLMEDLGKGIKGFRKGLGDEQKPQDGAAEPPRQVQDQAAQTRETDRAPN
ncbi:twin-arginine translocase TatA/TatE family subunit [Vitreimonas sp.]|uniref:twin-arginine translocase TatA/TatE family subunit n=1 Tax=Vitreimonas sp. TaxID=3069702 RepID=UPI002D78AECF|nr:twin-arginine translocase TatA/TatE family subunit [Vitreimonas sp.]